MRYIPNSESPLLPFNKRIVRNREGRAIRLKDVQGLQILAKRSVQQFRDVFSRSTVLEDIFGSSAVFQSVFSTTSGQTIDANDFLFVSVHHGDNGQGESIVIAVRVPVP